jgi:hypothetical protein
VGRIGRLTSSPWQFGQRLSSTFSAQAVQNVHSKEQILASVDPGGQGNLLQNEQ